MIKQAQSGKGTKKEMEEIDFTSFQKTLCLSASVPVRTKVG